MELIKSKGMIIFLIMVVVFTLVNANINKRYDKLNEVQIYNK